jgi:chromosome segregation ATPase
VNILRLILGFLADWLKRLSDPAFEKKQDDLHREVRKIEEAAKRHEERVAGYKAEADKLQAERDALATNEAATQDAIERNQAKIDEVQNAKSVVDAMSDDDVLRARF